MGMDRRSIKPSPSVDTKAQIYYMIEVGGGEVVYSVNAVGIMGLTNREKNWVHMSHLLPK